MRYTPRFAVTGIVIKRKNYGESDRIITLLTPGMGKLRLLVKGVRRMPSKRAGHIELFSLVTVTVHHAKFLDIVTEAEQSLFVSRLRTNLSQISYAYYLCELVDVLVAEKQGSEEAFQALSLALLTIEHETTEEAWEQAVYTFALLLLRDLGFLPKSQTLASGAISGFVERIIEKKLTAKVLLTKIAHES